ncbi:hypothetical protein Sta7437_1596 [Stanieria cyanosphaera PCC 7437]|uniref:Uncharacterized protein n=1 Tax=Stanieria cyanosphaera (strain ATCC 29371 / PCC 7437) TaxID=111780 RepID=K9XU14_STAC7|nr:hypothetical protein [Stanieria cyanosphaera]AFZ35162.1 hypothetical protein Sta7437_1596 [Stanieria cyanosphaera PCC 7437]
MTIIVKHKRTGNEYLFLGINEGGKQVSLPSRFLNDLFVKEEQENSLIATLCDAKGNIFFSQIDEIIVTEVEGKKPSELLPKVANSAVVEEYQEEFDDEFDEEFDQEDRDYSPLITPPSTQSNQTKEQFDDNEEDWI